MNALPPGRPMHVRRLSAVATWIVSCSLLAIGEAATAYYQSFASMKPFDDEGGLITLLRDVMQGGALYKDVHSIYGPAFFLYQWLSHLLFIGSLPSNDSVRLVSIGFQVLCAVLAFILIRMATRSWMLALAGHLLVFRLSAFLGEEPAHPQELCLLLLVGVSAVAVAKWSTPMRSACLAGAAGAMVATKINAGAMLTLVVGVVFLFAARGRGIVSVARAACVLAALSFAPLLMWPNIGMPWAQRLLTIEECSVAAMLLTIRRLECDAGFNLRDLGAAAAGFGAVLGGSTAFAVAHGASLASMVHWLIIVPRQVIGGPSWYLPLEIPGPYLLCAIGGVVLAVLAGTRLATPARIAALQLGFGLAVMTLAATQRVGALMCLAPPFLWLIAVPAPADSAKRLATFARGLIGLTATVFLLYAYPIAGVQVRFADIMFVIAAALILGDALSYWVPKQTPEVTWWLRTVAAPAVALLILASQVVTLVRAYERYSGLEPLNLPGAARLRFPDEEARGLREISAYARTSCSQLITVPGMPSFNLWTGLPSNPSLGAGNWVTGAGDDAQNEAVRSMASESHPCVIYNEQMVNFWTHHADVGGRPAVRYIRANFRPVMRRQGNELLVRDGAESRVR